MAKERLPPELNDSKDVSAIWLLSDFSAKVCDVRILFRRR
jgi:hypothetical protein